MATLPNLSWLLSAKQLLTVETACVHCYQSILCIYHWQQKHTEPREADWRYSGLEGRTGFSLSLHSVSRKSFSRPEYLVFDDLRGGAFRDEAALQIQEIQ